MRVRFWGTRGSVAVPGPATVRYGGNTSCVEVVTDGGTRFILDCGTGVRELGNELVRTHAAPMTLHVLLSHTHWDHIQGFPFFSPAFSTQNRIVIYSSGASADKRLDEVLAGQMEYTYFPVTLAQMGAHIDIREVGQTVMTIGDARVTTHYLNHTATCLAYRIESGGASLVYATDHEPFARFVRETSPDARPQQRAEMTPANVARGERAEAGYLSFVNSADLLIADSQYTEDEYPSHHGWGHSTCDDAVKAALHAGVKRLALYHHDPSHSDDAIDAMLAHCRQLVAQSGKSLEVLAAAERNIVDLPSRSEASA